MRKERCGHGHGGQSAEAETLQVELISVTFFIALDWNSASLCPPLGSVQMVDMPLTFCFSNA